MLHAEKSGRPGRSGDVIGCGCGSPPTRPRNTLRGAARAALELACNNIMLSNLYGRISRVVKGKYRTSAAGTSVMRYLDNE